MGREYIQDQKLRAAKIAEYEREIKRLTKPSQSRTRVCKELAVRRLKGELPYLDGVKPTECRVKLATGGFCRKPRTHNGKCAEHNREYDRKKYWRLKEAKMPAEPKPRGEPLKCLLCDAPPLGRSKYCEGCQDSPDRPKIGRPNGYAVKMQKIGAQRSKPMKTSTESDMQLKPKRGVVIRRRPDPPMPDGYQMPREMVAPPIIRIAHTWFQDLMDKNTG
jgi:hypothetical protein